MFSRETTTFRLLITVKTYPSPSVKYEETVCCAGITENQEWVRLYPVRYRDLPSDQQFRKYDIIEIDAERPEPHKDERSESWKPRIDTMKIVDHLESTNNWAARRKWIEPTILSGYAELCRIQQSQNKSLSAFRPAQILGIRVKPEKDKWSDSHCAIVNQSNLFSVR